MTPIKFILDTATALGQAITTRDPLAILRALEPLLLEFGTSSMVLDEAAQASVAARVHGALRPLLLKEDL